MKWWWKLAISILLMALIFTLLPAGDIFGAMGRITPPLWLIVLAGFVLGHLMGVIKWRTLVNAGQPILLPRHAVQCYAAGLFANLCLPSIVGGDILRAAMAGRLTKRPEAVILGSVVDRITDLISLGLLITAGSIALGTTHPNLAVGSQAGITTGMMAIIFLAGMVVVIAMTLTLLCRPLWRWPQRWRRRIGKALAAIRRLSRRPRAWLFSQSLSLVIQGGFVLLNAAIGSGLGIEVPLAVWFIVWPLAKIAGLLPISLGGLAVREATLAALLVPFGVLATNGIATSLLWQTILIAGGLIAGLAWLVLRRHQINNDGHVDNHDQVHGDHA